ncbi:MAG TPA: sugar ABC transporter permease, partial [Bacillota bacterium]|nr:sugar ABC transporter permease [Bacillota bacterium]
MLKSNTSPKGNLPGLNLNQMLKGNLRQYVMFIALIVVTLFFQVATDGVLLKPLNISNLIAQNAYILILAIGMLLCILICGNIDLSIGSVAGFVGAVAAVLLLKMNMPVSLAIGISLLIGFAIGGLQGFIISYIGVPAFITTLAGMLIFRGLTMVILQGTSLAPMPESFNFLAAGFLPDIANVGGVNLVAILIGVLVSILFIISQMMERSNKRKFEVEVSSWSVFIAKIVIIVCVINALTYTLAIYRGIPMSLIVVSVLVVIYSFVTQKTIVGRHIYAYGGNPKAAMLSGVKTKKILFWVYVNMGVLAALAGIIFTGRLNSATPKAGNGFEMDAIGACFIGGASTTGGIGTVV